MYFLLWAALLCCHAVYSRSTVPISRKVSNAQQLAAAVRDGVRDIEIRAHIDLRTSAQGDNVTDTLTVPAAVQTIRVRSHSLAAVSAGLCGRVHVAIVALSVVFAQSLPPRPVPARHLLTGIPLQLRSPTEDLLPLWLAGLCRQFAGVQRAGDAFILPHAKSTPSSSSVLSVPPCNTPSTTQRKHSFVGLRSRVSPLASKSSPLCYLVMTDQSIVSDSNCGVFSFGGTLCRQAHTGRRRLSNATAVGNSVSPGSRDHHRPDSTAVRLPVSGGLSFTNACVAPVTTSASSSVIQIQLPSRAPGSGNEAAIRHSSGPTPCRSKLHLCP